MYDIDIPQTTCMEEQIKQLKKENDKLKEENLMLTDCLLEMSQVVYGGDE